MKWEDDEVPYKAREREKERAGLEASGQRRTELEREKNPESLHCLEMLKC